MYLTEIKSNSSLLHTESQPQWRYQLPTSRTAQVCEWTMRCYQLSSDKYQPQAGNQSALKARRGCWARARNWASILRFQITKGNRLKTELIIQVVTVTVAKSDQQFQLCQCIKRNTLPSVNGLSYTGWAIKKRTMFKSVRLLYMMR